MTITTSTYAAEIEAWRRDAEVPLRRDWVSLVGRFEVQPGSFTVGSEASADIRFPAGSAPADVGLLRFEAGVVTFQATPGAGVKLNGILLDEAAALRTDADTKQTPDVLTVGSITFFIIERGSRTIVRVRDANSPALAAFGGRRWFPIDEDYRVEGVFTPYNPPKPLAITNLLGDTSAKTSPGFVTFTVGRHERRLDAVGWRDGGLVLHFRDTTNGNSTYGGGRAVVTSAPQIGLVTVDFNRTSNLPCVFTEFATCPLPPEQNRLDIAIEAGELLPS
jgi:uncharacterized protein (DUF1684 family)